MESGLRTSGERKICDCSSAMHATRCMQEMLDMHMHLQIMVPQDESHDDFHDDSHDG
jgi:hypothetical protein